MKTNEFYIDYLNKDNKFRETRIEFTTYDEAKKWLF